MLLGWAEHGNLMSIKMTLNLLKSDGLKPDLSTYAALLYGYGKFNNTDKVKEIMNEMNDEELNPEHIFYKCLLTENQAKGVMSALQLVDPNYKASIPPEYHNINYPSLVKTLYESMTEELDESENASNLKDNQFSLGFDDQKLQGLLEEQLCRELCGTTVIKSVEKVPEEEDEEMKKLKGLYEVWRDKSKESLVKVIEEELMEIKQGKCKKTRQHLKKSCLLH